MLYTHFVPLMMAGNRPREGLRRVLLGALELLAPACDVPDRRLSGSGLGRCFAYTSRIAQLIPVLLVLSVAVFSFVEALPGSIVDTLVGTEGGDIEEARAILTKEYGLDRPVYERYVLWLGRALQFDFGNRWSRGGRSRPSS